MKPAGTVLVVDDDAAVRAIACEMFEELGATALDAPSGLLALSVLRTNPQIGLVFADIRMPGMDGIQLAGEIRKLRADLRIVLTSGSRVAGAERYEFVQKPWAEEDLKRLLS
jgi:CheY-like chemotaxis protein